ncbi:hypothetical protein LCGC14_1882450 [marine sediment metagenome]|uniref:Uncharacterized protein n=1 Tax=marine sediment metagenome TaxID=412755 RepID=A0A0F9GQ58_9ZZZZ
MKRIALVALLVVGLVGVPVGQSWALAPWERDNVSSGVPSSDSFHTCFGAHGNICLGTDRNGIGYIRLGNAFGGVYIWAEPTAEYNASDVTGDVTVDSHSISVLRYAHSRNIEIGLSDLQLRNMDIAFTSAHGREMAVAHECTIGGASGTYTCP